MTTPEEHDPQAEDFQRPTVIMSITDEEHGIEVALWSDGEMEIDPQGVGLDPIVLPKRVVDRIKRWLREDAK